MYPTSIIDEEINRGNNKNLHKFLTIRTYRTNIFIKNIGKGGRPERNTKNTIVRFFLYDDQDKDSLETLPNLKKRGNSTKV